MATPFVPQGLFVGIPDDWEEANSYDLAFPDAGWQVKVPNTHLDYVPYKPRRPLKPRSKPFEHLSPKAKLAVIDERLRKEEEKAAILAGKVKALELGALFADRLATAIKEDPKLVHRVFKPFFDLSGVYVAHKDGYQFVLCNFQLPSLHFTPSDRPEDVQRAIDSIHKYLK